MKLLGWMHRKFRQNNGDALKDYVVSTGPSCNCLCLRPSLDDQRRRPMANQGLYIGAGFSAAAAAGGGEDDAELFEGFLAIGTLGSVSLSVSYDDEVEEGEEVAGKVATTTLGEPETAEAIVEKQEEEEAATEAELMVVGAELEKVLAAEAEKEGADMLSSARPSHASSKGAAAGCPLQEYLFASAVEVAEKAGAQGRKEPRASLGELFMMAQVKEEGGGGEARGTDRVHVMVKKMLRRRGSGSGGAAPGGSGGGAPGEAGHAGETKFSKLLRIFHRKVHPENTMALKTVKKSCKHKTKDGTKSFTGGNYYNNVDDGYGPIATSKSNCGNEVIMSCKSRSLGSRSDSNGSREYWIKTDSDYLVLEL